MLLAIGPLSPLTNFLQIICWIILPVLLLTIAVTVIHHYVRKKQNAAEALEEDELNILTSPDNKTDPAYLYFDHSGILRQYQDKLSYSHARYAALKKDFEKLDQQYRDAQLGTHNHVIQPKINQMENTNENLGEVSEQLYLKDLLEENKAQVAFLQAQLEQRVRKQHEAEHNLLEKEKELQEKQQVIHAKEEHIAFAEGQIKELREQNELLNATVADNNEKAEIYYQQLQEEQSRVASMEKKLVANKQLLQRLYREFSSCMEEEEASVVVPLRPAYWSNAAEE